MSSCLVFIDKTLYGRTHESSRPLPLPLISGQLPKQLSKLRRWLGGTKRTHIEESSNLFLLFRAGAFDRCLLVETSREEEKVPCKRTWSPQTHLTFNNITTSSLQAMISQAVENVLSSANKFWPFGRLFDNCSIMIPSTILALRLPWTLLILMIRYDSQTVPHSRASHYSSDFLKI